MDQKIFSSNNEDEESQLNPRQEQQHHHYRPNNRRKTKKTTTLSSSSTTSISVADAGNSIETLGIMMGMHLEAIPSSSSPASSHPRNGHHQNKHHHQSSSRHSHHHRRRHHEDENKTPQSFWRQLFSFIASFAGLLSLILMYCCIGGIIFRNLESAGEVARASKVIQLRNMTVSKLWNITDQFNVLYKENWTALVSKEIVEFQQQIIEAVKEGSLDPGGVDSLVMNTHGPPQQTSLTTTSSSASFSSSRSSSSQAQIHSQSQWSFAGSFLYSLSLITTMGFGNVTPKTDHGKLATIFYTMIGIPLMILYLSVVGNLLANAFRKIYGRFCSCWSSGSSSSSTSSYSSGSSSPTTGSPSHPHRYHSSSSSMHHHLSDNQKASETEMMLLKSRSFDRRSQRMLSGSVAGLASGLPAMTVANWSDHNPYITANGHIPSMGGHPASTMIDLSSDPHSVPCGSCEFCVREAAVLSVANVAGLTDHHHHVCVQDLGGEAAGLTGGSVTTATLSRSNQMNAYGTLGHHQGNVTFDSSLDNESNMRSNSRLALSNKHENSSHLPSSSLHHHRIHVPVTVCLIIIASYIVLGGLIFSKWNPRWSLLDGSFFSFVSLTTVGLSASPSSGEALFSPHGSLFQGSNKKLIACIFYLFIGFALLSMSFHLVYHDVVRRVKRCGKRINQWFSCKASDKSGTDQELTVDSRNPYDSENEGIS